jgi:RNA polymerase sigma-70 factor, ECF subfamily
MSSTAHVGHLEEPRAAREAEFERLAADARRRARSFALRLTHSRDDADDLVQDTLIRAWRGFATFRPERPFVNWVLRIMQRTFVDAKRRENPIRRAVSIQGLLSPSNGESQEIPLLDPAPGPLDTAMAAGLRDEMVRVLSKMPEPYRTTVVLCDVEQLSYAEIAERQECTIGTVRSRIHRGRRMLRQSLSRRSLGR